MARARNIKPGLFKNEVLGVADALYTLLFEGLWLLADREGRLEDRPLRIKAEVFPYREGLDVSEMLNWLQANGFIRRYRVGGAALIQIDAFTKHQNPHKNEPESELPSIEEIDADAECLESTSDFLGSTRADSLSLDSGFLIPATPAKPPSPSLQRKAKAGFDAASIELPEWLDRALWSEWVADRRERGKPITARAAKQQIAALDEYRANGHTPDRTIRHAIASGNQGLYPPPKLNGFQAHVVSPGKDTGQTAAILAGMDERAATSTPPPLDVLNRVKQAIKSEAA